MDPTNRPLGTATGQSPDRRASVGSGVDDERRMGTNLNLFPDALPPNGPVLLPQAPTPESAHEESRLTLWLHRLSLVIFVVFCVEIGMLLAVLPWTRVWTDNSLLIGYPVLKHFLQQNFVRGAVTGIGILDVWLGIWEAVRYRENNRK